jgi:potassium efflux system protein
MDLLGQRRSERAAQRLGTVALPFSLLIFVSFAARAQHVPPEPTVATVSGQIERLEAAEDVDEATRRKLLDLYRQALDELRSADDWAARAAEFEAEAGDAPIRVAGIRAQLAEVAVAPAILPDASLADLEAQLLRAEIDLAREETAEGELDSRRRQMVERRTGLPGLLTAARRRAEEAERALRALPVAGEPTELTAARRILLLAGRKAADAEAAAYETEVSTREARNVLLRAETDLAARRVSDARRLVEFVFGAVHSRRLSQAESLARAMRESLRDVPSAPASLRKLGASNVALAEERVGADGLFARTQSLSRGPGEASATLASVRARSNSTQGKLRVLGLTETTGLLLRREKASLPDVKVYGQHLRNRRTEIARVQLRLVEVEDERAALVDLEARARQLLLREEVPAEESARDSLLRTAVKLLQARRELLDTLIGEYGSYFDELVRLDSIEQEIINETETLSAFIDEHVLWVRSARPLGMSDLGNSWRAAAWLLGPRQWAEAARAVASDPTGSAVFIGGAALALAVLMLLRRRLRARLVGLGERASDVGYGAPVKALALTVLVALPMPLIAWVVGWRLGVSPGTATFPGAVGAGLRTVAMGLATFGLLRHTCDEKGLAESHFRWSAEGLALARKSLTWLMVTGVPLVLIVATTEWQGNEAHKGSLGRVCFLLGTMIAVALAHRLLRPRSLLWETRTGQAQLGWFLRLRHVWYILAVGAPVVFAGLAALGYYYTALQLTWRLVAQLWLLVAILMVEALLYQWIFLARRNLALRRARQRKAASMTAGDPRPGPAEQEGAPVEPGKPDVDLHRIGIQSRKFLWYVIGLALLVGTWLIWADVLPALGILRRIELWTRSTEGPGGAVSVTLAHLLFAVLLVVFTALAAANVPGILEVAILQRLPLDQGARFAVTAVAKYAIGVVGVVVALGLVGVTWASVQWLVAAMTVGLGFGLQEIFANFVSGLIILLERPIRIGDVVTVGGVSGTVSRIRIRATTITDWDRKELVVPNREFITGQLVNWSLSDKVLRVVVPVGIAYGSDTELAQKTLLEVAAANPHVLDDPAPVAMFMNFGDSSLEFELRVFVPNIKHYLPATSTLHMEIDQAFRKAGIEIAFPQRDVHVRSISQAIPFVEKGRAADASQADIQE